MGINSSNYSAVELESSTAYSFVNRRQECVETLIQVSLLKESQQGG